MSRADAARAVRSALRAINGAWTRGRPERVAERLHADVVFADPEFRRRLRGRAACTRSFVEFARVAKVRRFGTSSIAVDASGGTAVAAYRFEIDYEVGGKRCREAGRDVWVFALTRGKWLATWRTMLPLPRSKR